MVFEHSCVASVCENNQPVMVKIHPLIFFLSKKIINSLSEWAVSDSPSVHITTGGEGPVHLWLSLLNGPFSQDCGDAFNSHQHRKSSNVFDICIFFYIRTCKTLLFVLYITNLQKKSLC